MLQFLTFGLGASVVPNGAEVLQVVALPHVVWTVRGQTTGGLQVHHLQAGACLVVLDREHEVHASLDFSDGAWYGGHTCASFPPPTRHGQGFAGHLEHREEGVLGPQTVE